MNQKLLMLCKDAVLKTLIFRQNVVDEEESEKKSIEEIRVLLIEYWPYIFIVLWKKILGYFRIFFLSRIKLIDVLSMIKKRSIYRKEIDAFLAEHIIFP